MIRVGRIISYHRNGILLSGKRRNIEEMYRKTQCNNNSLNKSRGKKASVYARKRRTANGTVNESERDEGKNSKECHRKEIRKYYRLFSAS